MNNVLLIYRNYPTIANVTKKKQQDLERKDRRQVLDTPLYRYTSYQLLCMHVCTSLLCENKAVYTYLMLIS